MKPKLTAPLWYPYTQMKDLAPLPEVSHAEGVFLYLDDGRALIDGISSWWSVIHGYNHPELNRALKDQLADVAHVMLGGLTHEPALRLAEKLIEKTPSGLNHVFFSDSGSVGMEVALKIALQYWQNKGRSEKQRFVALKKGYHGDTFGVMAVSDPEEGMHHLFSDLLPHHFFLASPKSGVPADKKILDREMAELEALLQPHHEKIAALVVEPLMQGAGGFNLYSADYLNRAGELCKRYDILTVFDEVATGFGRTGTWFAADQTRSCPDIMVLGKALTGGYLGHAATLTTTDVFRAFEGTDAATALMHGPTFMANPMACAVALKSIEIFEREDYLSKIKIIEAQLKADLLPIRSQHIKDIRVLGGLGVIEVHDPAILKAIPDFALKHGVWLRPFGNVVYTTPPYIISSSQLSSISNVLSEYFRNA